MRGTDRPAGILVLMLIACPVSGASGADQSPLALPDVSVTAPPITPPWKKFSPYLGNTRVEEDKWPNIPCTGSRIASAGAGNCKRGPSFGPAALGTPQGASSIQISNCRIAHDLVVSDLAGRLPRHVPPLHRRDRQCRSQSLTRSRRRAGRRCSHR